MLPFPLRCPFPLLIRRCPLPGPCGSRATVTLLTRRRRLVLTAPETAILCVFPLLSLPASFRHGPGLNLAGGRPSVRVTAGRASRVLLGTDALSGLAFLEGVDYFRRVDSPSDPHCERSSRAFRSGAATIGDGGGSRLAGCSEYRAPWRSVHRTHVSTRGRLAGVPALVGFVRGVRQLLTSGFAVDSHPVVRISHGAVRTAPSSPAAA